MSRESFTLITKTVGVNDSGHFIWIILFGTWGELATTFEPLRERFNKNSFGMIIPKQLSLWNDRSNNRPLPKI